MGGSVMMLPRISTFGNSNANLTPIYIQPSAPQQQVQTFSADDLKQVNITNKKKKSSMKLIFSVVDSRHVPKYG